MAFVAAAVQAFAAALSTAAAVTLALRKRSLGGEGMMGELLSSDARTSVICRALVSRELALLSLWTARGLLAPERLQRSKHDSDEAQRRRSFASIGSLDLGGNTVHIGSSNSKPTTNAPLRPSESTAHLHQCTSCRRRGARCDCL